MREFTLDVEFSIGLMVLGPIRGFFGLNSPEEYGGFGMGKTAMCVVSEELSRGYIGVGSLGTRSEIAAELILGGGTAEQKSHYLPKLASGEKSPVQMQPRTPSLVLMRMRPKPPPPPPAPA